MRFLETWAVLLGAPPRKPASQEYSEAARAVHEARRVPGALKKLLEDHRSQAVESKRWRNRRWATLIGIQLLFILSYRYDVQVLEGSLTASRFLGLHLADLYGSLQVMLASKMLLVNLAIGMGSVFALYLLLGGRTFCSWVCPYHLLSELGEVLHLRLKKKRLAREVEFARWLRPVLFIGFLVLAALSGFTLFETLSPVGILSRALIYGPTLALLWVGFLLLFEVFVSRRAWCRYFCPIGLAYAVVGVGSPLRIRHDLSLCRHEGRCKQVCLVPHVLEVVTKGYSPELRMGIGPDCTRCGACLDACPTGALKFEIRGLGRLMED